LILEAKIGNWVEVRVWPTVRTIPPERYISSLHNWLFVCGILNYGHFHSIAGFRLSKPSELDLVLITVKLSRLDIYRGNPRFL